MLIGIAGLAGSGKDTIADIIVAFCEQEYIPVLRLSFAEPIKRMLAAMYGAASPEVAVTVHDAVTGPSHLRQTVLPYTDGATARHMLQTLGTEWGRNIHEDLWIRLALARAETWQAELRRRGDPRGVVVTTDCRFVNEFRALTRQGPDSLLWHVVRPGYEGLTGAAAAHASERDLRPPRGFNLVQRYLTWREHGTDWPLAYYRDAVVLNDGDLDQLRARVRQLLRAHAHLI